ncbi:MAG TPA: T9SS type A sorting domain-containing protein, partial [Chitinophagales bacterium]|nr:T9SS type A sorting domain-containing protein [Chitinophagales bacterium]
TDFAYSGDPPDPEGWSLCTENGSPSDFRFIMSSGPFRFDPGEVQTFDLSVVWDNNSVYPCPSYSTIIDAADCVDDYFKSNVVFTGLSAPSISDNLAEVFPNPVPEQSGSIDFQLKDAELIRIYDVAGTLISALDVHGQTAAHIHADFRKGLYIYQVIFRDQSVTTGKFLVL